MRVNSKKNSFIFYFDWAEILDDLPEELQLSFLKAIINYAINKEKPTDKMLSALTVTIRSAIDRDTETYTAKCERNRQIAEEREKQRRAQMNTNVHERAQTCTNVTHNDNDNGNDNGNGNDNDNGNDIIINNTISNGQNVADKSAMQTEKKSLSEREKEFRQNINTIGIEKYGEKMCQSFCDYWTEHNISGQKMRFEKEKVFDPARRLAYWNSRDKGGQFHNREQPIQQSTKVTTDEQGNRIAIWADGTTARLGVGEYINAQGEREYNKQLPFVPRTATPRPGRDFFFNRESNTWTTA